MAPQPWQALLRVDKTLLLMVSIIIAVPLTTGTPILDSAGKRLVFELLGSLLLALVLSQATLPIGNEGLRRFFQFFRAGPHLPICLFLTYGAVSALRSDYRLFSLIDFFHLALCALIYYACVYRLSRLRLLEHLCTALLLAAAAASLLALAQMANTGQQVVSGPFQNHMLLGSFLMLLLPLALSLCLLQRAAPLRKMGTQAVALLIGAALLAARARSAWVGELVSLVILAGLWFAFVRRAALGREALSKNKHLLVAPLALILSAVTFLYFSQMGDALSHRLHTFSELGTDNAFQARLFMWRGIRHMIAQRPLVGWGIGTYTLHEPGFTHLEGSWAAEIALGPPHTNFAHNHYLQTLAELGVVGLGLYLAVLLTFFTTGLRALSRLEDGTRKTVLLASLAAVGGQVIDAAASPAYSFVSVNPVLWLLMGMGMSCALSAPDASSPAERGRPQAKVGGSGWGSLVRFAAATSLVFALVAPLIKTTNPMLPTFDAHTSAGGGRFEVYGLDNAGRRYAGTKSDPVVLFLRPGSLRAVTLFTRFVDGEGHSSLVKPSGFRLTGNYQSSASGAGNANGTFTVERVANLSTGPDTLVMTATYTDRRNNDYAVDYPIEVR